MPVLKVRDPNTGAYVPLLSGGLDQGAADLRYVLKTGDTMTGNLAVDRIGSGALVQALSDVQWAVMTARSNAEYAEFRADAPQGKTAGYLMQQGAKTFWKISKTSGAAGDLAIGRYDDAGAYVNTPLSISRITGKTTIADLNYQDGGLMSAASGWADYGSTYGGMLVTKHCGMVTIEGMFKRTAADISVGSTTVLVGTIPAGFRPVHDLTIPVQAWTSGGYPSVRGIIYETGELRIQAMPAVTIATGGWVSFVTTFRGA